PEPSKKQGPCVAVSVPTARSMPPLGARRPSHETRENTRGRAARAPRGGHSRGGPWPALGVERSIAPAPCRGHVGMGRVRSTLYLVWIFGLLDRDRGTYPVTPPVSGGGPSASRAT